MKDNKRAVCPGCKRHCPACNPRCKYGKKYFESHDAARKTPKWARSVDENGLAWQLLSVSRSAKKALRKEKIDEAALFMDFTPEDRLAFSEFMVRLQCALESSH